MLEARRLSEAGPMVDGGVSIAVRRVDLDLQADAMLSLCIAVNEQDLHGITDTILGECPVVIAATC